MKGKESVFGRENDAGEHAYLHEVVRHNFGLKLAHRCEDLGQQHAQVLQSQLLLVNHLFLLDLHGLLKARDPVAFLFKFVFFLLVLWILKLFT